MFAFALILLVSVSERHTFAQTVTSALSESEWNALRDFYNYFNGDNWFVYRQVFNPRSAWDVSSENRNFAFCDCVGEECWIGLTTEYFTDGSTTNCSITAIQLNKYNLDGFMPDSIVDMQHLSLLELRDNYI